MLEVRLSCFVQRILAALPQNPGREQALYQIGLPKSECWRPLHESAPNQSRIQEHMPKQHQNCRTAGLADHKSCHFEGQVERRRQEFMADYLSISITFRLHRLKKKLVKRGFNGSKLPIFPVSSPASNIHISHVE